MPEQLYGLTPADLEVLKRLIDQFRKGTLGTVHDPAAGPMAQWPGIFMAQVPTTTGTPAFIPARNDTTDIPGELLCHIFRMDPADSYKLKQMKNPDNSPIQELVYNPWYYPIAPGFKEFTPIERDRYGRWIAERTPGTVWAITVADDTATPTYPLQGVGGGNIFPFKFVSPGFTDGVAGRDQVPTAVVHPGSTPDGWVFCRSFHWIPLGNRISIWAQRGCVEAKRGMWFTDFKDQVRLGKSYGPILQGANGYVREFRNDNYGTEVYSNQIWYVRNRIGEDVSDNTWVHFHQFGSVAYLGNGACFPG